MSDPIDNQLLSLFSEIKRLSHEIKSSLINQPPFFQKAAIQPHRSGYNKVKPPFDPIHQHHIYYIKPLQVSESDDGEVSIELTNLDYNPQPRNLSESIHDIYGFSSLPHRALNAHHRYVGYIICSENQTNTFNNVVALNLRKDEFKALASEQFKIYRSQYDSINNMLISRNIILEQDNFEIITRHARQAAIDKTLERMTLSWKTSGDTQKSRGNYQEALKRFPEEHSLRTEKQIKLMNAIHKYPDAKFVVRFKQRPAPVLSVKYEEEKSWEKSFPIVSPLIIYKIASDSEFRVTLPRLQVTLVAGEIVPKQKTTSRKKMNAIRLVKDQNWFALFPEKKDDGK
ncbi:hypothetical protein [Marinomonas algicola]|uniref:hypothetical protein n=1 Tax=Marinomonas algicola TaxID=2773454 RepID=UPI00174B5E23|nr:hypothetical protein [Marinomonas algicola]